MSFQAREIPRAQGLYNPVFEHDACGIGAVVNMHGQKSHKIILQALTILKNLAHRGGAGSESNTGDGAGILIQIPDKFFRQACPSAGIELPSAGEYGAGMVFLPRGRENRGRCEQKIEEIVAEEGLNILGWRTCPVNQDRLGEAAKASRPFIRQLFIGKRGDIGDTMAFERRLYVVRKRCESLCMGLPESSPDYFYFASLSCRTIVYKGMLTADQVAAFYVDLTSLQVESALALVHSRYSTNTFPSWERAHPYRYIIHNGEINTIRGNVNWMRSRQSGINTECFGTDIERLFPIINENGSDSAMFDNCLEFLHLAGRSLPHAAMMMVPEPWAKHESMSPEKKAFYEFHSMLMEPWDGPAAVAFTDGVQVGALLDRNGLRPSRYCVTKDGLVVLASEAGVLDIPPEDIISRERLRPGRMLLIDTEQGRIITDDEIKHKISSAHPYRKWLNRYTISLDTLPDSESSACEGKRTADMERLEKAFGYTHEDIHSLVLPMARDGAEAVGAMGQDVPLAVLSDRNQLLYNYFKQLFAQVTNPPIDAYREDIVTATETYIGADINLVDSRADDCYQIKLNHPILSNRELERLRSINKPGFKSAVLPILFSAGSGEQGLKTAMDRLFDAADSAIDAGSNILILSDRGLGEGLVPIPALLAVSGLHHHLVRRQNRIRIGIILESGEPREVHHFALLLAYGVSAVNPWLAFDIIDELIANRNIYGITAEEARGRYINAAVKGVVKVLSKMGISTIQSYQGAQIFEALGIGKEVIDKYFTATPSRIGGIGLDVIAAEAQSRHDSAFDPNEVDKGLPSGGQYQWRKNGEYHRFNPMTIHKLQQAVRSGDYALFKEYSALINQETQNRCTLRGLLELIPSDNPVPLDEVEPVESIVRRFKTGAMSYGSISKEAHETLAIAMNRLGGKSNSGEGGEDPQRFIPMENGDSKCSAIKQVASGRFGVTGDYLVHAKEIQIKIAQGAKPGEGGQLPGRKVYPWIASTRHSTPGVGLISPPPHHDIYSIEDLAELIHDLKNANREARISVKLVSEVGVGTVAAGVAKGRADVVLISGYDGGTGASPKTSIQHAGLPWELGLAETHQTLMLNDLRDRIVVETDGKLLTGRDVVVAALLGAEEFGFATAPLITLGCVMMRVCNLDTCPVGVATQNPVLRERFCGKPEYVMSFMRFIAQEVREIMAQLGFRTIDEMVGHTDRLRADKAVEHWKASGVDLSPLLYIPDLGPEVGRRFQKSQDHRLEATLDRRVLIPLCRPAIESGEHIRASFPIKNTNRAVATQLGSEITRRYGPDGLPDDTIHLHFRGTAGQSFGTFIPKGITLELEGEANDYIAKGLSGGRIIVYPDRDSSITPEHNVIIGNVALYGATSGEAYIRGIAGERFCVRNSGAVAVVEGVGDHGCEYMTGGRVVVLGSAGRNFAAGMSGGIAYVLDLDGSFESRCNKEMVELQPLNHPDDIEEVCGLIRRHVEYTKSEYAADILARFNEIICRFVKVMPGDYQRMLLLIRKFEQQGMSHEDALIAAFEEAGK